MGVGVVVMGVVAVGVIVVAMVSRAAIRVRADAAHMMMVPLLRRAGRTLIANDLRAIFA